MKFWRLLHIHNYKFVTGSMVKNGKNNVDWALNLRPEYDAVERCKCGKERIVKLMSYADKPTNRMNNSVFNTTYR